MSKEDYDSHYSDSGFQEKVQSLPKSAGTKVLRMALTLYVLLKDPDVPVAAKAMIIGVLGYFIFPLDLIPDFLPGGYIDDLAIMAGMVGQCQIWVTPEIECQVEDLMPRWAK